MNKVVKRMNLVRGGDQPSTFPIQPAAPAPHGHPLLMKNKTPVLSLVVLALCAGCKTPVQVTAGYGVPGTNITATVDITTNGASVGGNYQTGATNIGAAVVVGK